MVWFRLLKDEVDLMMRWRGDLDGVLRLGLQGCALGVFRFRTVSEVYGVLAVCLRVPDATVIGRRVLQRALQPILMLLTGQMRLNRLFLQTPSFHRYLLLTPFNLRT